MAVTSEAAQDHRSTTVSTGSAVAALVYVGVVLALDTLASYASGAYAHGRGYPFDVLDRFLIHACRFSFLGFHVDFRYLHWQNRSGFDWFKFIFWFLVPLVWSLRTFDVGYFGLRRWRWVDWYLFPSLAALGVLSLALIPFIPSLHATYSGLGRAPWAYKWYFARYDVVWTLSWITGWEFMHRYFLLGRVAARWPRLGWILVPVMEGLYHLQKPPLEACGMVVFSIVACRWTLSRKNILLPFGAHLAIELGLLAYLLVA